MKVYLAGVYAVTVRNYSCGLRLSFLWLYFKTLLNSRAITTVEIVVTKPGRMKL